MLGMQHVCYPLECKVFTLVFAATSDCVWLITMTRIKLKALVINVAIDQFHARPKECCCV